MATVPKFTRNIYNYNVATGSFLGAVRQGSSFPAGEYPKYNNPSINLSGVVFAAGINWIRFGSNKFLQGATYSVKNHMTPALFDEFIAKVRYNVFNGITGQIRLRDVVTSPAQLIMWGDGSSYSSGMYLPDFVVDLSRITVDSVSGERYITGTWYFWGCRAGNFTGGKFTSVSQNNLLVGSIQNSSTLNNQFYTSIEEIYTKFISKVFFTLGPPPNNTETESVYKVNGYPSGSINSTIVFAVLRGCQIDGWLPSVMWKMINGWGTGGSWTNTGQVDPTDPGETPTPKPPDDPDPVPPDDPWDPIQPNPDPTDPIDLPVLPGIGGTGTGFFHVYSPSLTTLRLIADAFWTSNIIQQIVNYFTSPLETIIGLGIIPVKPQTGDSQEVHFGLVGSGISAPVVTSDYVIVNCGTRYLEPYYNSYLDYEPYTKMSLYIPYIGEFDLNPDECTGKTIGVSIYVNVITGDLVGMVTANGTLIYTGAANCFRQLPVTSPDMSQVIQSAISAITTIAAAGAAGDAGVIAGTKNDVTPEFGERMSGAVSNVASIQAGAPLVRDVMSSKLHYHRCGQIGTGSGQLAKQKPFLTILRPNLMLPDGAENGNSSDLKAMKGYPSNQIMPLTNASGMTVIEDCRLSIPGATDQEIAEALEIMKGGYIA